MDCQENTDPLKLIREGTSQQQRTIPALAPAYVPVNERTPAHEMVFAQAYARYLRFYNTSHLPLDHWQKIFTEDVSVQLALAAVQPVDQYQATVKEIFDFLNDRTHETDESGLKKNLGYLFSIAATLARQLDGLKNTLPTEIPLKGALQNLMTTQLAPGFRRLIAYYKADLLVPASGRLVADLPADVVILGSAAVRFSEVYQQGLAKEWITDQAGDWPAYTNAIAADSSIYGLSTKVFDQVNHIATHNLFTAVFDQFLKVFARVVADAKRALEDTFTKWDRHEPHYALFLAFLRLQEYTRQETNTLTQRHLDFYYRDILRLREKPAQPGHAHLLLELAKHVASHVLEPNVLFSAGKDGSGKEVFFANDHAFVANQAKVAALKTVYRHGSEAVGTTAPTQVHEGRIYASPVANSDDGLKPELTSVDQSWHPFFNKIYGDGELTEINMPAAEVGWAIASHYLWLAEGKRTITVEFTLADPSFALTPDHKDSIECWLSSEEGWLIKAATQFGTEAGLLRVAIELTGEDPAVTAYASKTHGYTLETSLPVLLIKLRHQDQVNYLYPKLQEAVVQKMDLTVQVTGLKTLAVANDFGPVDPSKPFQPFGPQPVKKSALVIGSKEIFQKTLTKASVGVTFLTEPAPYKNTPAVRVNVHFLQAGEWKPSGMAAVGVGATTIDLTQGLDFATLDQPDASSNAFYGTSSRHGFLRLSIDNDFGQLTYQQELSNFLLDQAKNPQPKYPAPAPEAPPAIPVISEISFSYTASQVIALNSSKPALFSERKARFYHLAPFGQAEQHPFLKTETKAPDTAIYLVPPLKHLNTADDQLPQGYAVLHEAELYVGLTGLLPPQNLSLLFQVADGTADPLAQKPVPHLHWSYLRDNEWIEFSKDAVEDPTQGLIHSGIVTLAVPRAATATNTLLPAGMHWVRLAVAEASATACRLLTVAAQALRATFADHDNDPDFPANGLASGTIRKLAQPQAAVKKVVQPFNAFGGRGQEDAGHFYTRVSERLRHKDRALALWDYEHLVLEAFPQIYQVKCLNHTHYEPKEGIYKELAPGHVSLVTIPNQQFHQLRDPLRPYTSLGLLQEIADFLKKRQACFVKLHVKNPQFEEVRVSFKVRLYEGFDETFYTNKLKEAITRFLSPWAFPGGGSPSFGGKIYKSVLINFVEEQPYVDYVTDFQLFHHLTGTSDREEVAGSKAVSILVSVPAKKHAITPIHPAEEEKPHEKCPCDV